jgi:hypothetical protein
MTFVGAGMICSHLVNISLLLGAVLSYGLMWPLIGKLKGDWFPKNLQESDMKGLYGYKVSLFLPLSHIHIYFTNNARNTFLSLIYPIIPMVAHLHQSFLGRFSCPLL